MIAIIPEPVIGMPRNTDRHRPESPALAVSISSGTLFLLLLRSLGEYKPSYSTPKGIRIADILTGLTSLGLTLALFSWIRR